VYKINGNMISTGFPRVLNYEEYKSVLKMGTGPEKVLIFEK